VADADSELDVEGDDESVS
jgi:hypothetical protein